MMGCGFWVTATAAVALAGCIDTELSRCENGRVCADGLTCDEVAGCVSPRPCVGIQTGATCSAAGLLEGVCFDGECVATNACTFGEVNDTLLEAFALTPVASAAAGICTLGDRDFYQLSVPASSTLSFEIAFTQDGGSGDLDLRLFDATGTEIARSLSADDNEAIVCPGSAPACGQLAGGEYVAEVFGFNDTAVNTYMITYAITPTAR